MTPNEWLRSNYHVVDHDVMGTVIVWGNQQGFYAIYTPVDKFIEMFENPMQEALDSDSDVKQAIRDSDPENAKGFHEYL